MKFIYKKLLVLAFWYLLHSKFSCHLINLKFFSVLLNRCTERARQASLVLCHHSVIWCGSRILLAPKPTLPIGKVAN